MRDFFKKYNIIRHIPVFANLKWYDIQKIARKAIITSYRKGEIVSQEGNPPDYFYCVVSGRLQAFTQDELGHKENVDFIHKGMYFGIISLFTGENHSLNFETINDSVILKIPQNEFKEILQQVPQLAIEFSEVLSKRIRRKVKGKPLAFESEIISIYSPQKETGASTFSFNLALSLFKETQKRIILVHLITEMEPAQSAAPEPKQTPALILNQKQEDLNRLSDFIIKNTEWRIDFLCVRIQSPVATVSEQDGDIIQKISPLITSLVGEYHYVVVDLPTEMEEVVLETLIQSDQIFLLSTDRRPDLALVSRMIDRLERNLKDRFKVEKIRVLIRTALGERPLPLEVINRYIDYNVFTVLPVLEKGDFQTVTVAQELSFLQCPSQSAYDQVVTRVARTVGKVLVGLVLGGGAALGIAHIGVLKVLEENNIPVDIVVGSSMGALIGSLWVTGRASQELIQIGGEFETVVKLNKLVDLVIPISGLIGGRGIKKWLIKYLGDKTFYTTRVPFKVLAYDLMRREEIVIENGSLVDAVRQSISIPGVMEPVKQDDRVIIDGGVLNPLPTSVLVASGIKKIIAVNVLQSPSDVSKGIDALLERRKRLAGIPFWRAPWHYVSFRIRRALSSVFRPNISEIISMTIQATEYEIAKHSEEYADVNIHPDLSGVFWWEFYKVEDLIARGEAAARSQIEAIHNLLQRGKEIHHE